MHIHMKKRANTRQRNQDKMVIDHLTSGRSKADTVREQSQRPHEFTESEGRKLDKAIGKKWTSNKGGLPDF